jgi:hypothetical protein
VHITCGLVPADISSLLRCKVHIGHPQVKPASITHVARRSLVWRAILHVAALLLVALSADASHGTGRLNGCFYLQEDWYTFATMAR